VLLKERQNPLKLFTRGFGFGGGSARDKRSTIPLAEIRFGTSKAHTPHFLISTWAINPFAQQAVVKVEELLFRGHPTVMTPITLLLTVDHISD
jgi:hypothetical protein